MNNNHICADAFLVNTLDNIACVLKLEDRSSVKAPYGTTRFTRKLKLTPGTYVDTTSPDLGFRMVLDPPMGDPAFPAGVTITGSFSQLDVSGSPTAEREVTFTGVIEVDRDLYAGGLESVKVTLVFNPGGSDS